MPPRMRRNDVETPPRSRQYTSSGRRDGRKPTERRGSLGYSSTRGGGEQDALRARAHEAKKRLVLT